MKARLPAGMGGGAQSQKDIVRRAQKMQEELAAKQNEIEQREFSTTSGGGMVEVVMNGNKEIKSLTIKPEIVDPDDVEMLQDVITAAVNEVIRQIEEVSNEELSKITSGLNLPGLF